MTAARAQLVVALDVPTFDEAQHLVRLLTPLGVMFKIGFEPLYGYGERIIELLERENAPYFLDAKLHDIPRTVSAAVRLLVRPNMRILNIHALGGFEMMAQTVTAANERAAELGVEPPLILAVTMLTSMDEASMGEIGIPGEVNDEVLRLALLARFAGCAGVVAGVTEAATIKASLGADFRVLCPGIRPAGADAGDQKRIATPAAAVAAGADFLVVGRPIVAASDPVAAAQTILVEMSPA
jgi:orotidine-5'-phosphate decarboxylase